MPDLDLNRTLEQLEQRWKQPIGLLLALVLALGGARLLLGQIEPLWARALFFVSAGGVVSAIWWRSRTPRPTAKGRIGVAVAILCESGDLEEKLRSDFVLSLRESLSQGSSWSLFQLIEVPEHLSARLHDHSEARKLSQRLRCHLVLYGRARTRVIHGVSQHVINLNGLVTHRPIPRSQSQRFSQEFSQVLPRKIQMAEENDVLTFELMSSWAGCVAKYIVGVAKAISGDFDNAEVLFADALQEASRGEGAPAVAKVSERVPLRLAEMFELKANLCHDQWRRTEDDSWIDRMGEELSKIPAQHQDRDMAVLLRSILLFVGDRDVDGAIKHLREADLDENPAWHANLAFLLAYKGELAAGARHYRDMERLPPHVEVLNQVEDFLAFFLKREPDRFQLHYCLGCLYRQLKGDLASARRQFRLFVDAAEDRFKGERQLAEKWIAEIDRELKHVA